MPRTSLLSTNAALIEYEEDYSDLEPEERAERSQAKATRPSAPEDWQAREALAAEQLGVARQNATLFRARRLASNRHGLEEPERFFRTGIQAIDDLLAGGLKRDQLVEVVGWRSSGRFSLTLSVLAGATQAGESTALVDLGDHFDPQAALGAGIDLERLLWLRPQNIKQALGATELLLGAGFSLVVLDLGQPPLPGGRGIEAAWLRLQRGAIDHHCALLVSSPYRASGTAAHAVLELNGARGGWFGQAQESCILGGLVCEAGLTKSRLIRTKRTERVANATVVGAKQRAAKIKPSHLFELTFASGLAEPVKPLPKLLPRKRRERRASPAQARSQRAAGGLRHAG